MVISENDKGLSPFLNLIIWSKIKGGVGECRVRQRQVQFLDLPLTHWTLTMPHNFLQCDQYCSPLIHVHLEPQNVTLLGNRVFADVIKVRIEELIVG